MCHLHPLYTLKISSPSSSKRCISNISLISSFRLSTDEMKARQAKARLKWTQSRMQHKKESRSMIKLCMQANFINVIIFSLIRITRIKRMKKATCLLMSSKGKPKSFTRLKKQREDGTREWRQLLPKTKRRKMNKAIKIQIKPWLALWHQMKNKRLQN